MRTNDLLQSRNMQINFTFKIRTRNNSIDAHDSVIPSTDSLSTMQKHNEAKQKGHCFGSPTNRLLYAEFLTARTLLIKQFWFSVNEALDTVGETAYNITWHWICRWTLMCIT